MEEKNENLYTPIVLRTGFLHSYGRTLSVLFVVIILELLLWTLAGFWPRLSELGVIRWGLIVILTLAVPIGTWTIRDITAGYEDLFNVFDAETENRLKLYRSLSYPPSNNQEAIQSLFKDRESFTRFRSSIRRVILERIPETTTIVIIICIMIPILYNSVILEKLLQGVGYSTHPLLIIESIIDILTSLLLTLTLSLISLFGLGYLRTISHLGASRNDLSIWSYVQHLHGETIEGSSFMSYWRFHNTASIIGNHFSRIAFRIVLLMVLGAIAQVLYNTTTPTQIVWILVSFPILVSILILVLPLNSLHKVMKETRDAVLQELEEEYDHMTLRFVSHLSKQRHSGNSRGSESGDEELAVKINALRGIIQETEERWTWPVNLPVVLRIIVTSMIPIFITILDATLIALSFIGP